MIAKSASSFSQGSSGRTNQTKCKEEANQPNCETHLRQSGEYEGKTLCHGNFISLMNAYACHTFSGATETPAMAFRVSTMHCAQAPSSR